MHLFPKCSKCGIVSKKRRYSEPLFNKSLYGYVACPYAIFCRIPYCAKIFVYHATQGYPDTPKILLSSLTGGGHLKCGPETRIVKTDAKCAPCWNIISKCKYDGEQRWQLCMGKIQPKKVIQAIEAEIRKWRQRKIIQIAR